ncbi:MAG: TerB family tellurite resistance protein [Cyclobacteriaceae bacterium]
MLPIKDQLSILVHLSKADKVVAKEERMLIHAVGRGHGLDEKEIDEIIELPNEIGTLKDLPTEEKFDYLYTVIQLMKIDKKIYQSEIQFCEKIAMKLGYKPGVVADLSQFIYSDPTMSSDRNYLRKIADKQLMHKAEDV